MRQPGHLSAQPLRTWGKMLFLAVLAGLGFFFLSQHRLERLQGYEIQVLAPLTARSDIMPLYAQSPFRKMEIEFPPVEIAERFVLRIWEDKDRSAQDVETELKHYLERFYATSQTRIDMRLSSKELELSALQAAQRAKAFELEYLQRNYAQMRAQRIVQLHDEVRSLGGQMDEIRRTLMAEQGAGSVTVGSFQAIVPRNLRMALKVQSLLLGLFVAMLQILWLQRKSSPDASF